VKQQHHSVNTNSKLTQYLVLNLFAILFIGFSSSVQAANLRVMKTGLGKGWIEGTGISCGIFSTDPAMDTDIINGACNATSTTSITLTARSHTGSTFAGWGGDCANVPAGTTTCIVSMNSMKSVRAKFTLNTVPRLTDADLTPAGINSFLTGVGSTVNTQAEFVAALPPEFRQNWILMTRSESLQTGTGASPRIMLVSEDSKKAFTLSLAKRTSYPGSHPNAIEFMQWDDTEKNFRFHEIVVEAIPAMDPISMDVFRFPARPMRRLTEDDPKCFACHSTKNVRNRGATPGTTGNPIGAVKFKSKPNWDTYDSWGGMLAFNRDRIYKGSVEAAAFRKLMNLWSWQNPNNEAVRSVIEQLELQPPWVTDNERPQDRIKRWDKAATVDPTAVEGGPNDGHIRFNFDPPYPIVQNEPLPTVGANVPVDYTFNRLEPNLTPSTVTRNTEFVVLQHSRNNTLEPRQGLDEGRGSNFFNNLYLGLNPQRIVDEMTPPVGSAPYIYATGSVPIDVRPIALAIAEGCIFVSGDPDISSTQTISGVAAPAFFEARNGMDFNGVYDDTSRRAASISRRKADIQKLNLDRTGDIYVSGPDVEEGLITMHAASSTDGIVPAVDAIPAPTGTLTLRLRQLRQEIFRRPVEAEGFAPDRTAMRGKYVDREKYGEHTSAISLYRYFLEPLGVSVDKWSLGVRGRSRTYSFADQFNEQRSYTETFKTELRTSLSVVSSCTDSMTCCTRIMPLVSREFARLPAVWGTPTYTDIQRIFNKSCIECHGGLNYPPVKNYARGQFDLSEDENPAPGESRLWKSLREARTRIGAPTCSPIDVTCTSISAANLTSSRIYLRITDNGNLRHPYDPSNLAGSNEDCPNGLMPCGGPPLSNTDIETIKRWIVGSAPNTEGDPHIRTVDGVNYDFQSTGEFVLLRDPGLELQVRQSAVTTAGPLGPNAHTGLSSCVSLNTAVAMRVGDHRITYQPILEQQSDGELSTHGKNAKSPRLELRIDGNPASLGKVAIPLKEGGRIVPTNDGDGLEVQLPGGERIAVTPSYWEPHQLYYMNISVFHGRATEGIMGAIAPNNWLPTLSNGDFLGPRPVDFAKRHHDLFETFADSWRVNEKTSLFYYEPGLTPAAFIVPGWPVSEAQNCLAPQQPGVPVPTATPASTIGKAQAEKLCSGLVDVQRRENCIQDAMATGDPIFAETYLKSQNLDQRILIAPPELISPPRNGDIPGNQVDFEWKPVAGTEVVDVTHYHCLWRSAERYDFNKCTLLAKDGGLLDELLPPEFAKYFSPVVCIFLLLALLLIAVVLLLMKKRRAALLVLLVALILAVIFWLHYQSRSSEPTSVSIKNLEAGETYRWKVVNETNDGLITESETLLFSVQK
jgi:Divergent InlB B-repeat domain